MTLWRTAALNAFAVGIRLVAGLTLNKVLAVVVGPTGFGVIGQLQSVAAIAGSLAGGSLSTGVVRETAHHRQHAQGQASVWRTAIRLSLFGSLLVAAGLCAFASHFSDWLLATEDHKFILFLLAGSLPLVALNVIAMAVLNGKKEIERYVLAGVIGNLLGVSLACVLTVLFGLKGALAGIALSPCVGVIASIALVIRRPWFELASAWGAIDWNVAKKLGTYAVMMLTTATVAPLAHVAIRTILTNEIGWHATGLWQAMWKLSETYLLLITTPLAVYVLPRIAEIGSRLELKAEIRRVSIFAVSASVICAAALVLSRDLIIELLFTPDFLPLRAPLVWQLLGDILKMASFTYGYVVIGRAMTKVYITTEVAFSTSFIALVALLVPHFGLAGAAIAHALNYSGYFFVMRRIVERDMAKMG